MHPILFKSGPITVYSYGVFVALGFIAAGLLALRRSGEYGIERDSLMDLLFTLLIAGLIGGRALHVALNLDAFRPRPVEILFVHHGGLAIQGAILLASGAGAVYLILKRIPVSGACDLIAQYLPLGQAIGRIGCLLNGCCYGRPSPFYGVAADGEPFFRHPTQVYEALALIAIFFILRAYDARRPRSGNVLFLYFILYSAVRFFIDFFREDMPGVVWRLTASQVISAALLIVSAAVMMLRRMRR